MAGYNIVQSLVCSVRQDLQKQDVVQASETRMLTALRAEIAASEQRLEDERFAAASARQSFAAREHELEVIAFHQTSSASVNQNEDWTIHVSESQPQKSGAVREKQSS